MSKAKPLRWRKFNPTQGGDPAQAEYHLDIGDGWGVSLIAQPAGEWLCFVEKEEGESIRISDCRTYSAPLTEAKRLAKNAAAFQKTWDGKPKPKHYGAKVQCLECGTIVQSLYVHHYCSCRCGAIAVDGGGDYLRFNHKKGARFEQVAPGKYLIGK